MLFLLDVSNVFCYLFVKYRYICIYPSLFTLTKLSLDVYEEPHVYTLLISLRFILHVYENFPFLSKRVGDWKNQQQLDHK